MKQGLKEQIYIIFKQKRNVTDEWTNGGRVEKWAMERGYKASNASRRLRELASAGILEREMRKGSVWYRYRVEQNVF